MQKTRFNYLSIYSFYSIFLNFTSSYFGPLLMISALPWHIKVHLGHTGYGFPRFCYTFSKSKLDEKNDGSSPEALEGPTSAQWGILRKSLVIFRRCAKIAFFEILLNFEERHNIHKKLFWYSLNEGECKRPGSIIFSFTI